MFKRVKESLPDNRKSGLLAVALIVLIAGQSLSQSTNIFLLILRYALFAAAVTLYFYVAITHHQERVAKKKAKQAQENQSLELPE